MKTTALFLATLFLSGCGVKLVDDRPEPVAWVDTDVSAEFIYKYTDSVPDASWNSPPDSLGNRYFELGPDQYIYNVRSYYFPPPHEEIYRVKFTWPMLIEYVYSDSAKDVLLKNDMTQSEILRVEERFKKEVLEPMVNWGRERGLMDSVLFIH